MSIPTFEQLKRILPNVEDEILELYYPFLTKSMGKWNINTKRRIACFLAQIIHESGSFRYVEEIASGSAYEYREDLGNLKEEALNAAHANHSTTGKFYKGHGLIQITGFDNHKKCGEALGIDLVSNPRLLTEPEYAVESACWFWVVHGCNELADVGLFGAITKTINGGFNGAAERLKQYSICKRVLGV